MDHQTYPTRKAASEAKAELAGWPKARVTQIDGYASEQDAEAGRLSPLWVLECAPGQFLRADGYVG
jgi:hypothetical protein